MGCEGDASGDGFSAPSMEALEPGRPTAVRGEVLAHDPCFVPQRSDASLAAASLPFYLFQELDDCLDFISSWRAVFRNSVLDGLHDCGDSVCRL